MVDCAFVQALTNQTSTDVAYHVSLGLVRCGWPTGNRCINCDSHNETRVFHDFGTANAPQWKLVHCHKSPIATADSLDVLRG
jgi:hypothetical protein